MRRARTSRSTAPAVHRWLAEGRPPQTLVEADTARLNGIEIEQIVDILARDGAVDSRAAFATQGVGTRVRAGVVVDGFVAFGDRVRKLIATEPEAVTASAALKEVQELWRRRRTCGRRSGNG